MIRQLRRKFIWIAMLSLAGAFFLLCAGISLGNYIFTTRGADQTIQLLYDNGGEFPAPEFPPDPASQDQFQLTQETPFQTRYYIARLKEDGTIAEIDQEHIAALDTDNISAQVEEILKEEDDRGYLDYYRYRWYEEEDGGRLLIVLDCFEEIHDIYSGIYPMAAVFVLCIAIVFVLLLFLSKRAIRPFEENMERQKRFVTDASHELKTPIAILSANLGLLENMYGENQWFSSSKSQLKRLNRLIQELIELARTQEDSQETVFAEFSVSELAETAVQAFQPLAQEKGIFLTAQITPGLNMQGISDDIFRLLSILLDNGIQYGEKGGNLRFALFKKGKQIGMTFSNPCTELRPEQIPRLFDRFYRGEASRSRQSGGNGIGLSTARGIVQRHHGRIRAKLREGVITFTVWLPGSN